MWNLKYGTNDHLQSIDRLTEHRLMVAKGEAGRERSGLGVWGGRCKRLHLEWINKVLMYSTGNCIQNSVINHNGKEYWKRMCIREHLSQVAVQQRLAHCKSTILQYINKTKTVWITDVYIFTHCDPLLTIYINKLFRVASFKCFGQWQNAHRLIPSQFEQHKIKS